MIFRKLKIADKEKIVIDKKTYVLNYEIYRNFSADLKSFSKKQLKQHFITYGHKEERYYNTQNLLEKHPLLKYFEIEDYKRFNTDLDFDSDDEYVYDYLKNRINDGKIISKKLHEFKKLKRNKIKNLLSHEIADYNYLTEEEKNNFKITQSHNISSNEWEDGSEIDNLIKNNKIILNVGSGYRADKEAYFTYDNVINTEIFNYCTTDVVCNGDNIPFKDNSFDLVLSLDVLEHVKNPFKHASELIRVLKPNCIIYADVPFLQPYHGYPHHYYNMTTKGVQNLFGEKIEIIEHKIDINQKPVFTLTWFLDNYISGLEGKIKERFKKMTVEEIIENGNNLELDYVKNLSEKIDEINACGSTLIAKKRNH